MTPRSAKNKGKKLQNDIRDMLLHYSPSLEKDLDVKSTTMGEAGEDIQLSAKARKQYPLSIECKSRASFAFYKDLDQAIKNCPKDCEPILVAKANHRAPVVIIDADYFFRNFPKRIRK